MDKLKAWWKKHRPSKRRLIQIYAALLYNAHLKGFIKGEIFTGASKSFCVPGLNCYSCPGAIGACPLGSLQNALAASGSGALFYVLGIITLTGLILGRTVCGWLCPVGLIQELLHKIPTPKIKKCRVTRVLSYMKYLILVYFVIAIPLIHARDGVPLPGFCKYICPAGTLEGAVGLLSNSANEKFLGALGVLFTSKFVIAVAIFTLAVFIYRVFCRFLCPLGALYSLFSRFSLLGVEVDEGKCTGCGRCVSYCKMDIKHVSDRECIQCGQCMDVCPVKAITVKHGKIRLKENEIGPKAEKSERQEKPEKPEKKRVKAVNIMLYVAAAALLIWALWYGNFSKDAESAPAAPVFTAEDGRTAGPEPGMLCPDFELPLCGGEGSIVLENLLGKPAVINIWATWCGGCCAELPEFQRFHDDYGDRVNVIAVHSAEVTEDIDAFLADAGYTFMFALDREGRMIPALGGGTAFPQTVILDSNGIIVYNRIGPASYELLEAIVLPLTEGGAAEGTVTVIPIKTGTAEEMKTAEYTVILKGPDGSGIPGARIQICNDSMCLVKMTDENGRVAFSNTPYPYEVHIMSVPGGYKADTGAVYTLKPEGDTLEVSIEKAAD